MSTEWTFNPIFNLSAISAVSVIELLVVGLSFLWAASTVLSRIGRWKKTTLFVLRTLVIVLLLAAMLRPTLVVKKEIKQSSTLILLLDRTRSMMIEDVFGGKSRWNALKQILGDAQPTINGLSEEIEVKVYAFDSQTTSLELLAGRLALGNDPPTGNVSAIGQALEEVRKLNASKRLAGVILISDGAQQALAPYNILPQDSARRLAENGCPLYTVTLGQATAAGQGRDVAVKSLSDDIDVFVKNRLEVISSERHVGLQNSGVNVELLFEVTLGQPLEVVDRTVVKTDQDDAIVPIKLSYVPTTAGERKLTVRAAKQPGELVVSNNELSTFVTVRPGGLNVLYLEGEPRVEQRFLRRSLNASPDIKVDYQWFDHRDRKNWPVNVGDAFQPGKYDVYILGDLDSAAFSVKDLALLAKTVENGAGLLTLGGFHSYWSGGYLASPLAPLLPLREDAGHSRLRRQAFDEPLRPDLHLPGPIKLTPSARFGGVPFAQLAPAEKNAAAWAALPPLEGANNLFELKDNAQVVLESDKGNPMLVANTLKVGRVLSFAGDTTWHWYMQGHDTDHKRFWRQVILWLARKDDADQSDVWIKLDKRRFSLGERVDFLAGVKTSQGAPIADATFDVQVELPDGSRRPLKLAKQGDAMTGNFLETKTLGDYTVVVTARQGTATLGVRRSRFLTFDQDLELEDPAARPALMSALAKVTETAGGKAVPPEQLIDLLKDFQKHPPEMLVQRENKYTPWDTWPFLLAFTALLTIEWFLRKKWGLV